MDIGLHCVLNNNFIVVSSLLVSTFIIIYTESFLYQYFNFS